MSLYTIHTFTRLSGRKLSAVDAQHICVCYESSEKSGKIKRLIKETKSTFGKLLETAEEKRRRLNLEKEMSESSPVLEIKNEKPVDSEFAWVLKTSGKRLRIMKSLTPQYGDYAKEKIFKRGSNKKEQRELYKNSSKLISNSMTVEDQNCFEKSTVTLVNTNDIQSQQSSIDCIATDFAKVEGSNKVSSPSDVTSRILSVPIYNGSKQTLPNSSKLTSEILTLSQYDSGESLKFPSVTRILSATMSPESKLHLELWKKGMIMKLGVEGFRIYQEGLFENGKCLHSSIQSALTGTPFEVPENIKPAFDSVGNVLKDISEVKAVETHVVHPELHYRGIVDCVASYRGNLCVVDWKKSDKPKRTISATYDAPLQIASYIGALNADQNYPFEVKNGLVVVAYTNGDEASVYELTLDLLQKYWISWLTRLEKYFADQNLTA